MKKKILLADDEQVLLKAIEFRLQKDGYEVKTVKNGQEAMDELANNNYSMVISDLMMPGIGGMELLQHIKSNYPELPVLLLTGLKSEDIVIQAFDIGAEDFMTKPFNPKELSIRVKRLLP